MRTLWLLACLALVAGGCAPLVATDSAVVATATAAPTPIPTEPGGLSAEAVATLSSLERVDDHPLYTMHYRGAYAPRANAPEDSTGRAETSVAPAWACSLFAALADPDGQVFGRNFDWDYSPALLLFTDPPDGYASVSMVDIAFLGFQEAGEHSLLDLAIEDRAALLSAPYLPFDGMNDQGLVVGMAAVSPGDMRPDPAKETIGSVGVIREILDHAASVDEAVAVFGRYNVDMTGGPPIHYLIADRTGQAVLVEFYRGEMVVTRNESAWHQATNFLLAAAGDSPQGQCWRYDKLSERLSRAQGRLTADEAMELLASVAQPITEWSVVYGLSTGQIQVAMGRQYEQIHTFTLK